MRAFLLASVVAVGWMGSAHATLVDFDTLPDGGAVAGGTRIGSQYASVGVSFSLFEDGALVSNSALASDTYGGAGSGNGLFNIVGNDFSFSDANRADVLRMSFAGTVSQVSFLTEGYNDTTNFQAFDSSGTLLETQTNTSGNLATIAFTSTNIARIDALQSYDNYTYRLDNLSYTLTPTAVSEPASLALLGLGLAGIAAMRRRHAA